MVAAIAKADGHAQVGDAGLEVVLEAGHGRGHAPAYTLANVLRTLATPTEVRSWSLASLRERLVKTGARLTRHARCAILQFAEAALPRAVFAGVPGLITGLLGPPAMAAVG